MHQARLAMLHNVTHKTLVTTNGVGALICISSGKNLFPPSTVLCFLFVCLNQSSHALLSFGMERSVTNWGVNITRLPLQHVFCLYCCYFRNRGEHVRTMDGGPLHAVPVVDLPFPSLFVYVKLFKTKHKHTSICVHWFFHTSKTKSHIFHIVFPKSRVKFYAH